MAYRYREQGTQTNIASVINILAGLWLIAAPFMYALGTLAGQASSDGWMAAWNMRLVGFVVALFGVVRLASGPVTAPLSWVNAALGAWMIAAPWVIGYSGDAAPTWNSVIVGIIVLVMAVISATTAESFREGGLGYREDPHGPWRYPRYGEPASRSFGEGGDHRGHGPRGYRRADDQIRADVCDRMWEHPRLDASDIEVRVEEGEVTLLGTVTNREAKREAEAVAESAPGVEDVHNELRVRRGTQDRDVRRIA